MGARRVGDKATAYREIIDSRPALKEAHNYYEGNFGEVWSNRRLKRYLDNTANRYRINFSRTPVTAVLSRLRITHVGAPDPATAELVQQIWEHNNLARESRDFHEACLVYGECYALVWPSQDVDGQVDIIYQSPEEMRLFYDPENPRRREFAAKLWEEDDDRDSAAGGGSGGSQPKRRRLTLYYADRVERWVTKPKKTGDREGDWEEYIDQWRPAQPGELLDAGDGTFVEAEGGEPVPDWPVYHPYGQVPVFHFRTGRPHGRPEHRDAYGPQNIITKITVTHPSVLEFYAAPQRWWIEEALSEGEAEDFDDPDGDGQSTVKEVPSGPGWLWKVASGKVGQFDPADASGFLDPFKEYVQAMAAVTSTPLDMFKGFAGDAESGEARQEREKPFSDKCEDRRDDNHATWVPILQFGLLILAVHAREAALAAAELELERAAVDGDPAAPEMDDGLLTDVFPDGPPEVTIRWRPVTSGGERDRAQTVATSRDAKVMSRKRGIERMQPELDEEAVAEELRLIEEEERFAVPEPLRGTTDGNEEGDDIAELARLADREGGGGR
jgi:hypothetical protein